MTHTAVEGAPRALALAAAMREICGPADVLTDPLELRTYECDGLTSHRTVPALVVLPESAAETAAVVRACARAGVPFVARGSGTGLSGGAVPHAEGVLIVMSRMRRVLEIDPVSRRAVVEPGVTNLSVTQAAAPFGLFYAPEARPVQVICSVRRERRGELGRPSALHSSTGSRSTTCSESSSRSSRPGRRADLAQQRRHLAQGRRPATTCSARSPAQKERSASSPRSSSS